VFDSIRKNIPNPALTFKSIDNPGFVKPTALPGFVTSCLARLERKKNLSTLFDENLEQKKKKGFGFPDRFFFGRAFG